MFHSSETDEDHRQKKQDDLFADRLVLQIK